MLYAGLLLLIAATAVGCGGGRLVTIRTVPPDASIVVDGQPRPRAPITERFSFAGGQFHTVLVTRVGYTDKTILLDGSSGETEVVVQLKPRTRRVTFHVSPYPAIVKVDGRPISNTPVVQASAELEFSVDARNNWQPHIVTAERGGFETATQRINFTDVDPIYNLVLRPKSKTVTINTDPPGAEVIVDGTSFGPSPVTLEKLVIVSDPVTNADIGRKVEAIKPGLEPATGVISWDDGKTDYLLTLAIRSKTILLKTDPPDALVKLGGKVLPHRPDAVVETKLDFPPVNGIGELPVFDLSIAAPGDATAKYKPQMLKVGWDDGRIDYAVALELAGGVRPMPDTKPTEAKPVDPPPPDTRPIAAPTPTPPETRPVANVPVKPPPVTTRPTGVKPPPGRSLAMLSPVFRFEKGAWRIETETAALPIVKSTTEPDGRRPTLVSKPAAGLTPDGVVISPDGALVAWAALQQNSGSGDGEGSPLRSQLFAIGTTGNKPPLELTDGQSLDLMPSFSPNSERLLFTSDRIGEGRLSSYETMIAAQGFAVRAAPGETPDTELSPTLDSSPRPRLYVEARPSDGSAPRLVAIETLTGKRIDLGHRGTQPRVSPRADSIVFVRADAATGKRDIWLLKLGEDEPTNLTGSPDDDDYDPAWSKTGSRIAFASDRAGGIKPTATDVNLWVLRITKPSDLTQVTDNDARDDNPAWSGDDESLYFRSSRGGEWGIWKLDLPK